MAEKSIDEHEPNRIGHQPEAQRQHRTEHPPAMNE
jgi:hypothetical protein